MKRFLEKTILVIIISVIIIFENGCIVFSENIKESEDKNIPEKYDLRDMIEIDVKDQGNRGTCWAFSAINTIETYLKLHGYGNYDFSEMHLECIENGFTQESQDMKKTIEDEGGNYEMFVAYCENEDGPVLESEIPYYKKETDSGRYSEEDLKKFVGLEPKAYAYSFAEFNMDEYKGEEEKFYENVKKHIMNNGSLWAVVDVDKFYTNDNGNVTYYASQLAGNTDSTHAVSIIGWDDNYDRNNFDADNGNVPKNNGAFIALNSWGESFGENGIFYISYESCPIDALKGVTDASIELDKSKSKLQEIEIYIEDKEVYKCLKEQLAPIGIILKKYDYKGEYERCDDEKQTLYITNKELEDVKTLDIANINLKTTKGLEKFTYCEQFCLNNCGIVDLNILGYLPDSVEGLSLVDNDIVDLSPISKFKNLKMLELTNNVNIRDLTPLCSLNNLEDLRINACKIEDISSLRNLHMTEGAVLDLSANRIKNIDCLENFKNLNINVNDQEIAEDIKVVSNSYDLPSIFFKSKLYDDHTENENTTIEYDKQNVEITDDGKKVIFKDNKGQAIFKIHGGIADGTEYRINYETYTEQPHASGSFNKVFPLSNGQIWLIISSIILFILITGLCVFIKTGKKKNE